MTNSVAEYGWGTGDEPESCGYIAPKVLELLEEYKVRRVCDLGSGNGALASDLKRAGYAVTGVEYAQDGVRIAKELYPDINFYNLGVQDDPSMVRAAEGVFDAIVSTEVIEHLFLPHQLPTFARGLLDPGGVLIVTTPYHGYLKNLALSIFDKWDHHHTALWNGGHIKFWSRTTLSKLLNENGFEVIAFHGVGRLPFLWKSMVLVARAI
jgi:2-polyprenyl-3-methyl-5-hydroxy-6-metoxy-1,4-benzoquinol methylase